MPAGRILQCLMVLLATLHARSSAGELKAPTLRARCRAGPDAIRLQCRGLPRQAEGAERVPALAPGLRPHLRPRRDRARGQGPEDLPRRPRSEPLASQGDGPSSARRREAARAGRRRITSWSAAWISAGTPRIRRMPRALVGITVDPGERIMSEVGGILRQGDGTILRRGRRGRHAPGGIPVERERRSPRSIPRAA